MSERKLRSRVAIEGIDRTPHRAFLRAMGLDDDDIAKPMVGVVSTHGETTPCSLTLGPQALEAKGGVREAGGTPREFTTISVSDGVSMNHLGMRFSLVSRELIADSIEAVMRDDARLPHRLPVVLGEAVGEPAGQAVRFGIPLRPQRVVLQAQRAGQVDDLDARVREARRELGSRRVGQREEHDVRVALDRRRIQRRDRTVPDAREGRQRARARRARARGGHQRDMWMPRQDADEFLAGVARGARDGDAREPRARGGRRLAGGVGQRMHRKEYLYSSGAAASMEFDA